jgi:O-antigen ligase
MKFSKWITLLLFTQCFVYKGTNFVPTLQMGGLIVAPDRLVAAIIFMLVVWRLTRGELQFPSLGKAGYYILLFALISTVSCFVMGAGSRVLYYLFDFHYTPFVMFILAKSIPHSHQKLESLSFAFLAVGAYLVINGIFEYFGPHALLWPKYILDPSVGVKGQFGRTRGSFASSEALGWALTVTFLFYALYITRAKEQQAHWAYLQTRSIQQDDSRMYRSVKPIYWAYLMILVTPGVIYTTNQRSTWTSFGASLVLLAIAKTEMKRMAKIFIGFLLLGFLSGVGAHFSFWKDATLFTRRQDSVNFRLVNNQTTLAMGMENPIFGVGYGSYSHSELWRKYFRPIAGIDIRDIRGGNHNTFLGLFAEVGLVGLIPYLMIFYYMFQVGLRVYRKGEGFEREFALVFLVVVIIYIICANFGDYRSGGFYNTALYLLFGTVAGIEVHMALPTHRLREEPSSGQLSIGHGMGTAGISYKQWSEWKRSWDIQVTRFTRLPKRLDHV